MNRNRSRPLTVQPLESRRLLAAVDIPDDLMGAPSAIVSAPVNIDDAADVRGAEIRLSYDTDQLDLDPDAITAGSVWTAADTQITVNVDDAAGTVVIFVSASAELSAGGGSLVILPFSIASDAVVGESAVLDLTEVTLNEGQIPVTPTPIPGDDATDGLITVTEGTGDETIAGFVYADTNNNNTPETVEGIPGVVITLINTTTGESLQTTTDDTGRYAFEDLSPATYQIVQTQPTAYIDGGDNELSVTLDADETLADQNFRELGLKAQYVYSRLHTTLVRPVGSAPWVDTIRQINIDAANDANEVSEAAADASQSDSASAAASSIAESPSSAAGEPLPPANLFSEAIDLLADQVQALPPAVESGQSDRDDETVARDEAMTSMRIW
ncbi:SdrD B-like domain-containing protein [Allorhodopirellula solitaria]|nr:SdrD B-like domain-containing protein [Allorhodopirellula solitaria]